MSSTTATIIEPTPSTGSVQPTPSSAKSEYFDAPIMHFHSSGADDGLSAAAQPVSGQTPGDGAALAQMAGAAPTQTAGTAPSQTSHAAGADVGRKRSLLTKRRSLKATKDKADGTGPADAPAAAAGVAAEKDALAATIAFPTPVVAQAEAHPAFQADPKLEPNEEPGLSRSYVSAPSGIVKSDSIPADARSTRTAGARSRRSLPQSRAPSRAARGDSDDGGESDFASAESDEGGEASYTSPVSHHRRARSIAPSTRTARTDRTAGLERRSVDGARSRRAGTSSSRHTRARSVVSTSGGAFAGGAGTVGPAALPAQEDAAPFRERAVSAAAGLTQRQATRIGKEELREGKRLSKILKSENLAERRAVEVAIKELAQLQSVQKRAIKEEMRTHTAHSKALKAAHAAEIAFLEAQRKLQIAQAAERAAADGLESAREHAELTTSRVQQKNREVEMLRAQKAADVRERENKISKLTGKGPMIGR